MANRLTFRLLPRRATGAKFDWLNIDRNAARVGKVRGLIEDKNLTIYSMQIFPKFQGRGYARKTIEMFKADFDLIVADRVRPTASGFWHKMGFAATEDGNYVWRKDVSSQWV